MELSDDVVLEILSRLPVDELGKTRALTKYHAEVSHKFFYKELTTKHGAILDGFIFQDFSTYKSCLFSFASPSSNSSPFGFSLDFVPGNSPQIRATAGNGLVLVQTSHLRQYTKQIYSICKPSTKQCKCIPIPKTRHFTKSLAFFVLRSKPLHFKILRLSSSSTFCELFDSKTWHWKMLTDHHMDTDHSLRYIESIFLPVLASGYAHWKNGNNQTSIFAFDFYTETWSTITMPKVIVEEYEDMEKNYPIPRWCVELVEFKGKLGVMRKFYDTGFSTELWVMDNNTNRSWSKMNGLMLECIPTAFYGSDISLAMSDDEEVKFCSLGTNYCKSIKLGDRIYGTPRQVFPHITDFEPWNFHPPPRTLKPPAMATDHSETTDCSEII